MATGAMSCMSEKSRLDFLQWRRFIPSPKRPPTHFEARLENCEKRLLTSCVSVRPSVRPSLCLSAWNISAPTGRIFMDSVKLHTVLRSYTSVTDIVNEQC